MPTIEFTDRSAAARSRAATGALARAAAAAARAPSVAVGQPWRWRITGDVAELRADRTGQPDVGDPDGRLATISCGEALHHARTALAGLGVTVDVARLPEPSDLDLLARLRVTGTGDAQPDAVRRHRAIALRHTDRHTVPDEPVLTRALHLLSTAAECEGAHLRVLYPSDGTACVAVLLADADTPAAWLAAGEALSAVVVTATVEGLVVSPMTHPGDVPAARALLGDLRAGNRYPMLALHIGVAGWPNALDNAVEEAPCRSC
jgi:hypothetical protein